MALHSYACIYVPRTFLANFLRLNSVWQIILFFALLNANVSVKIFATFGERKIHSKRSLSIIMKRGAVGKHFRQVEGCTDSRYIFAKEEFRLEDGIYVSLLLLGTEFVHGLSS